MVSRSAIFIALFSLLIYANSLSGEFVWDDAAFVVDNPAIRDPSNPFRFFTDSSTSAVGELARDVYRPITTLSYAFDYPVWQLNSFGYHLTNIILHAANGVLVFMLFLLISGDAFLALFGGLIFASHPVQTEAVSWISGRSSVLFLFFYLTSLILYILYSKRPKRVFYYMSLLSFSVSLFSKEMSVTLPLVLAAYDLCFSKRSAPKGMLRRYSPYLLLAVSYVVLRIFALGKIGQFSGWGDSYSLFLTMAAVVVDYMRILLFPLKLCAVGYVVPVSKSIAEPRAVASFAILAAVFLSVPFMMRRSQLASFSIWWFFITLLPVLNIVPIKALEAERFLYLPSIGFAMLAASSVAALRERFAAVSARRRRAWASAAAALITFYSARTMIRNNEWASEIEISEATVKSSPSSAWALTALAANYIERNDYRKALPFLEKAVRLSEDYRLARNALGRCYLALGRAEDATREFERVVKSEPKALSTRNMLGAAYAELRRYDMAEEEFKTILKKDELFLNAYLNLGRVYEMKGEYKKALAEYFRYLMHTSEPLDAAVGYIRIGDLYRKMGSKEKALSYYRKADGFCGVGFNETRKLIRERVGSL